MDLLDGQGASPSGSILEPIRNLFAADWLRQIDVSLELTDFIDFIGAPGKIRTPDPQIRSLVLYPAELPVLAVLLRSLKTHRA